MQTKGSLAALAAASILGACGGGGSSSPPTAPLSLSVTDAPVNPADITKVCVDFTRISVHYADGDDVMLEYRPLASQVSADTHCTRGAWDGSMPVPPVRLDALGGPLTVALAESLRVPLGRITWIRLHFGGNAYVETKSGGEEVLRCPSCEATDNNTGRGFKLNRTFEVPAGGIALTVDIDLMKSLHEDSSGYVLRPTARIEVDSTLGSIAGVVDESLLVGPDVTLFAGSEDTDTGCAVYVFEGLDAPVEDYYEGSSVVSAARVKYDLATNAYRYVAGALPGGTVAAPASYTVALTCTLDEPLIDDSSDAVTFTVGQNASVIAGQTTPVDFMP